jgi:hypothetical protein
MKQFLSLLVFLLLLLELSAQRPPAKIHKAFEKQFPDNSAVEWSYVGERNREWTAHFHLGQDSLNVTYDAKANWLLTLTMIPISDLPEAVVNTIAEEYQGSDIIIATTYEEPGFKGYGVAFMYKKDRWAVQISSEGKIIRRRVTSEGSIF